MVLGYKEERQLPLEIVTHHQRIKCMTLQLWELGHHYSTENLLGVELLNKIRWDGCIFMSLLQVPELCKCLRTNAQIPLQRRRPVRK